MVIARYFGPGRFGQINYVAAFTGILQVFVLFGFDSIVLKDLGLGTYPEPVIIGTVIKIRLVLAGLVYVLGFALFYFFFDRALTGIYLILGLQFFMYSLYVFKQWYQIKSLNKYTVIASQSAFFAVSLGKIVVIILAKDVAWYAGMLVGGTLIEIGVLSLFFKKLHGVRFSDVFKDFDRSYCKNLFPTSLPLVFQGFAVIIYMKIDQIMIGKMLSPYEVGLYSIAVTISELIYFVPGAITNAAYPKIAQAKKEGQNYEAIIVKVGSVNILVCLVFAIICTFSMPFMVSLVYGDAYMPAAGVIQIHVWAGIFVAMGSTYGFYIIVNNLLVCQFIGNLIAGIMNIILNYFFILRFGIRGAAITTVLSQAFVSYFLWIFIKNSGVFALDNRMLLFRWQKNAGR